MEPPSDRAGSWHCLLTKATGAREAVAHIRKAAQLMVSVNDVVLAQCGIARESLDRCSLLPNEQMPRAMKHQATLPLGRGRPHRAHLRFGAAY